MVDQKHNNNCIMSKNIHSKKIFYIVKYKISIGENLHYTYLILLKGSPVSKTKFNINMYL